MAVVMGGVGNDDGRRREREGEWFRQRMRLSDGEQGRQRHATGCIGRNQCFVLARQSSNSGGRRTENDVLRVKFIHIVIVIIILIRAVRQAQTDEIRQVPR